MWRLRCSTSGATSASPMVRALSEDLFSLNHHVGRQTWEFDANAGTFAERELVEQARVYFAKHRVTQQHSSDELLRQQYDSVRVLRGRQITVSPPKKEAYDDDEANTRNSPVPRNVVDQAMRAGVDFYQGLQDSDGHWPSDYGGPMFLIPGAGDFALRDRRAGTELSHSPRTAGTRLRVLVLSEGTGCRMP